MITNTTTPPTPDAPAPNAAVNSLTNTASNAAHNVASTSSNIAGETSDFVSDFIHHFTVGKGVGIAGGIIGAWALGSAFGGGGIFGTIISVMLFPILAFLGVQLGEQTIDPMMGNGTAKPSATPTLAQQRSVDSPAPGQQLTPPPPGQEYGNSAQAVWETRYPYQPSFPNGCAFSNVCSNHLGGLVPYYPNGAPLPYYGNGTNVSAFVVTRFK